MKRGSFFILAILVASCNWLISPEHLRVDEIMSHAHELYQKKNYIDAIDTLNKAVVILSKRDVPEELANCYNRLGLLYWKIKDTSISMNFYNRALEFAKVVSPDLEAKILINIGHGYYGIGDYSKAYSYYLQVNYLNLPDKNVNLYYNQINLANVAIQDRQYDEARNFAQKALVYFEQIGDSSSADKCSVILMECDAEQKKPLSHYDLPANYNYFTLNLCEIYLSQNNLKQCESNLNKLIKMNNDDNLLEWAFYLQGLCFNKQENFVKSITSLDYAEKLVDTMNYRKWEQILNAKIDNYIQLKDINRVSMLQKKLSELNNKILEVNERNSKELQIANRTATYQYKMLEIELKDLKYELLINRVFLLIISLLVMFIIVTIYAVTMKKRVKSLSTALQQSVLRNRSNFFK